MSNNMSNQRGCEDARGDVEERDDVETTDGK